MTDHSERDEAASEAYKVIIGGDDDHKLCFTRGFELGADWAVKNDPRVLKIVEALNDICCERERHEYALIAQRALTEWSKP